MTDSDLVYVTVEMAKPRRDGSFPGRIEEGQYCVSEGHVLLYDMMGERLGREPLSPPLSAAQIASRMLKARAGQRQSDFGRKLQYPAGF